MGCGCAKSKPVQGPRPGVTLGPAPALRTNLPPAPATTLAMPPVRECPWRMEIGDMVLCGHLGKWKGRTPVEVSSGICLACNPDDGDHPVQPSTPACSSTP